MVESFSVIFNFFVCFVWEEEKLLNEKRLDTVEIQNCTVSFFHCVRRLKETNIDGFLHLSNIFLKTLCGIVSSDMILH